MKRRIINSILFKNFRKRYLQNLLKQVEESRSVTPTFLCNLRIKESKIICWMELKEVQNNLNSIYLLHHKMYLIKKGCQAVWFNNDSDRIKFLKECLQKFDRK